eukprot:CAMPEP_0174864846 /NCGR_PEP_ID=MMETSP1114-20130205/59267_1 /TAXON_ID=312471 /ORGANISM="Neobodo designis, Strain CCAP 1951/1" /LENGTH=103 /DNA_ID=CAMNT_0016099959 /DNA_START=80 /DNA_END=389 /DNA_ORIENTATION=-
MTPCFTSHDLAPCPGPCEASSTKTTSVYGCGLRRDPRPASLTATTDNNDVRACTKQCRNGSERSSAEMRMRNGNGSGNREERIGRQPRHRHVDDLRALRERGL